MAHFRSFVISEYSSEIQTHGLHLDSRLRLRLAVARLRRDAVRRRRAKAGIRFAVANLRPSYADGYAMASVTQSASRFAKATLNSGRCPF